MSTSQRTLGQRPLRSTPRSVVILTAGAVASAVLAVGLPDTTWARWAVALAIAITLLLVALEDADDGILAVLGYLLVLGLVRRLVSMVLPDPSDDPLLLVGPSMAAAYAVMAVAAGALRRRTPLMLLSVAFVALSVVSVFNVLDVGVKANARGLLFWTVPVLWFASGRLLADAALVRRLARLIAIIGTGSCLAGMYQVLVGLPAWDQQWFDERGYEALGIYGFGTLHPFGWAVSHTEFAQVAGIVMVVTGLELVDAVRRHARGAALLAGAALAISTGALALSAVRTAQLLTFAAVVVVILASGRVRARYAIGAVVVTALALSVAVRVLDVESWNVHGVPGLARRSLLFVEDPLGETSTLDEHVEITKHAFGQLDERPLGRGPAYGVPRNASDGVGFGAENDLGNAALAFGFVGLGIVIAVLVIGLQKAWRAARARPDLVTLATLGVLVLSLRYWWGGAHYSTAMFVWLLLGRIDRSDSS